MKFKTIRLKPFGLLIEPVGKSDHVSDLVVEELRELFWQEHLLVLRGFHSFYGAEDLSDYCERWGEISEWPFGKVLEIVEQEEAEDHIFDNNYVPLHWDGMYRPQVAEYQIFHSVTASLLNRGGRTTFSNTKLVLEHATDELRSLWSRVTGDYQRKMEFYNSKTVSPIIMPHPHRDYSVIRYNEPPVNSKAKFINPPRLEFTGISEEELCKFHRSLQEALYAPANFYAHKWETGDVVIADNHSLLHGREAFESRSPRHLRRVHILGKHPVDNPSLVTHQ